MQEYLRLGVNIDHVATIRNARAGLHPDPLKAALLAEKAGADGITAHLREDRRHISDQDILKLKESLTLPLNLEMAATEEMLQIALKTKPNAACIVPEKRQEVTTEGGLNIQDNEERLAAYIAALKAENIRVSLFLEPNEADIVVADRLGADIIEFHTGKYCNLATQDSAAEFLRIERAVNYAAQLGVEAHAGHGLDFISTAEIAKISELKELNIGHFIIGEAIFSGLEAVIKQMKQIIKEARV